MANYPTLDFLPDLSSSTMDDATALWLSPYIPTLSGIDWDNSAYYSTSRSYAILYDTFKWNATEGATYDIVSKSYFDPFIVLVYDSWGNVVKTGEASYEGSYGTDWVWGFVAPYTGTFYVSASWNQGNYFKNVSIGIYEDIDTASSVPVKPGQSQTSVVDVIVDSGVLGAQAVLLKGLVETTVYDGGNLVSHTVKFGDSVFDYSAIDPLISTVVRDGMFTGEFSKEVADFLPSVSGITYQDAVSLVGVQAIDNVILAIAGADGFYVS